ILTELYRLLIFYLREHRISVALTVEVALVSTLREVMLRGAHELEWLRILALSLLLVVLGGLLAMERGLGRWRKEVPETDAG
ncbi:MAG TPA: phosphate-starvation-inducible PsiE family protein, partial [Gemmataceae bacterium]|nr:phosphate-starvation-inducible PsiE family protein [Gemmataceae bacterium]